MNVKATLIAVLLLGVLAYWLLPNTKLLKRFKMNTQVFYLMNILGIAFGTLGLIMSLGWPNAILQKHYFELILLPILFVYLYTGMASRATESGEIYDEKQNLNMTQAAALTWPASMFMVFVLYAVYQEGILSGPVFFPILLYSSFVFYSASTLYYFVRS